MAYDADDVVAKATTALETSVKSIIDCDDDEATKREALAETFGQFADYMERNLGKQRDDGVGGDSVGEHALGRLADVLVAGGRFVDRAHALRFLTLHPNGVALTRTHKKESPMPDTVLTIMKDCGGPVAFAKTICDTGRSYGVSEQEYVSAAGRHQSELHGLPS